MKYADDIVRAMDVRGSIKVPEDCFASEEFDVWMYGEEEDVKKIGNNMPVLDFNIIVNFSLYDEYEHLVVAKTVAPNNCPMSRNSAEANNYIMFIDNLLALLDYYDFDVYNDSYRWPLYCYYLQHNLQFTENNVPVIINLRVSQHTHKHKSDVHLENTQQKQRYKIEYIIVNNDSCNTYKDALDDIELQVREWFDKLHIPLNDYEYIGNWE